MPCMVASCSFRQWHFQVRLYTCPRRPGWLRFVLSDEGFVGQTFEFHRWRSVLLLFVEPSKDM